MKKFAMAAVAAAAMTAGVAQAYTAGTFSNGVVVPNVIHNGPSDTTAVGLVNQSGFAKGVFWTFFDQNSKHITDGCFVMTDKDYEGLLAAFEPVFAHIVCTQNSTDRSMKASATPASGSWR